MPETKYDLVVVGGGTGGYVAAIRASQLGFKAAVVERDKLGGTCLHRGCIPSKALLRSAEVFSTAKQAAEFGVLHDEPRFDLNQAMARKTKVVDQLHKGIEFLMKKNSIDVYRGVGRVMGPSIFSPQAGAVLIEYGDGETQILSPNFTLIATGSRPKTLPGLDFDGEYVLSSDDVLELHDLPSSLLIVGAGAIGVEWASMLADLGVSVTLVEFLPRVLPQEDEEISKEVARLLKKRGVKVLTEASVAADSLEKSKKGIRMNIETKQGLASFTAEKMLVSVGRVPNTDDIGLSATDIQLDRGAIVVDTDYRTAESSIYAIGDVIGGLQLAHVAAHEGIHAVEVMAGSRPRRIDYSLIARCTYSRPEVASVGLTEQQARDEGRSVKVGKFQFRAIGKALVYGEADGFVKVIGDEATGDVLGVHMVGPHVTDLISEAGLAHVLNAAPWEIGQTIHPHPTLSEALGEAALAVDGMAIHS